MNMYRRLNGVVLVLAVALGAGGMAEAQRPGPGGVEGEELPMIESWRGTHQDESLQGLAPEGSPGFITDAETWGSVWRAWLGEGEPVPTIDFTTDIVLVHTVSGPNNIGWMPERDAEGHVRGMAMTTLMGGPGFGYLLQRIAREGVKTINDRPLPAVARAGGAVAPDPGEAAELAGVPSIRELENLMPRPAVFGSASVRRPLVLRTAEDAARCFAGESMASLNRQVDFDRQFVLLFAWSGSGQDRLTHVVAESFPEQIRFTYTPGRTRDLRQHVKVYALRSNVHWMLPGETRLRRGRKEEGAAPSGRGDAVPGAAPGGEAGAVQRQIEVRVDMPTPAWRVSIREVVKVDGELWVISRMVSPPPDTMSAMVIAEGRDAVSGPWPDLPVRHFVVGHPWGEDSPGYTFVQAREDLPAGYAGGERLYRAAD